MKKKLLLLGVAVLVFQLNIKAQNATALERKANPKKFISVKNGEIQKKELIKEDKNIPLKGYALKSKLKSPKSEANLNKKDLISEKAKKTKNLKVSKSTK